MNSSDYRVQRAVPFPRNTTSVVTFTGHGLLGAGDSPALRQENPGVEITAPLVDREPFITGGCYTGGCIPVVEIREPFVFIMRIVTIDVVNVERESERARNTGNPYSLDTYTPT